MFIVSMDSNVYSLVGLNVYSLDGLNKRNFVYLRRLSDTHTEVFVKEWIRYLEVHFGP